MKNFLFVALIALTTIPAQAQNFDFIQPTTKHYFRNAESYIRGIRIDSVLTYTDSIVYHPFRTVRRTHLSSPAYDTASGCWLGKKITRLTDGTHYFETFQYVPSGLANLHEIDNNGQRHAGKLQVTH